MRSHHYQFTLRELVRTLAPTGLGLVVLALALNCARHFGWLPHPAANWDPDRTVLAHQARACHRDPPAQLVVTGDSTCLVGVDALQLSEALEPRNAEPRTTRDTRAAGGNATRIDRAKGPGLDNGRALTGGEAPWRALNLALYIWLDLAAYGELVSEFSSVHPGEVRAVVLLVSPAKLTAEKPSDEAHQEFWNGVRTEAWRGAGARLDVKSESGQAERGDWAGAQAFREHFLTHALATPLRGSAAAHFGFSSEIDAYMTRHRGSVLTFGTSVLPRRNPGGKTDRLLWILTPAMKADSRAFRAQLPSEAKLFIGLTPGMAGASSPDERSRRRDLLQEWNAAVQAHAVLTNLPPVLPDVFFSSGGHLNATGQRVFTRRLARELAPLLR